MTWKTATCDNRPAAWLGDAPGVDLEGSGLRDRVACVAGHCADARERAVALFEHVAQMPFVVSDLDLRCQPALLVHTHEGDSFFKSTLLVHLLRLVAVPARMRWVQLDSAQLTKGLWNFVGLAGQPLVYPMLEACIDDAWFCTDAYMLDPHLLTAVQRLLAQRRWHSGFLAHEKGTGQWDARGDSYQRFDAAHPKAMQVQDLGCAHSLEDFNRLQPDRFRITPPIRLAYVSQAVHFNHALGQLRLKG